MIEETVNKMLAGNDLALARLITLVEKADRHVPEVMRLVLPHTGRAHKIGITGPPGAGKSTLADRLISLLRKGGSRVAVLAVDPTSPFSGGAVLGDHVRMHRHYMDQGVYIPQHGHQRCPGRAQRGH